jgi:LuxR family maltose regulon positive regulatory protein
MPDALLFTKLTLPPLRRGLVPRPTLIQAMVKAPTHSLTLVTAPPGYGKTTLVSGWLTDAAIPYAWLSLDEGDNDPIRFLHYFLTALHQIIPVVDPGWLEYLQGPQPAIFNTITTQLINEAATAEESLLVLDDFHLIHTTPILELMSELLEHMPSTLHLVLLTRTDPPLPLARLRARGQLLEIRVDQLRFSVEETAQFFDAGMGLPLSPEDVTAIEARTEGWVAGLQLAGLAIQSATDRHRFVADFTGSHSYIMDYLTGEVLRHQPETIRDFLLNTAVLHRMCAPLCEFVVQNRTKNSIHGQAMLETLERNQLFVVPLDAERRWYRYHHLFREVLAHRLEVLYPKQIPELYRCASEWFEQQGLVQDAVRYAIQAGDTDRTANLVEKHGCDLLMRGELVTLSNWLTAVEPYPRTRPWLAMQKAWVLSLSGQPERADIAIKAGEQLLSAREPTDEIRTLKGSMAAARAHWANTQGLTDLAASYARQAIDFLSVNGDFSCALRSIATSLLGDASWVRGRMDDARQAYAEAVQIGQAASNPHMTMLSLTNLADVYFEQGKLHQAARLYSDTLQMAEQADGPNSNYAQGAHFGLSQVNYAWNQLDSAASAGEASLRLCRQWVNVNLQAACLSHLAQIEQARGRFSKAEDYASAAEALIQTRTLSPYWLMAAKTTLARFWLGQGKTEKALSLIYEPGLMPEAFPWDSASQTGIAINEQVPYPLQPAFLVLAHIYLAQGNPDAVLCICQCLIHEVQTGQRGKTVVELLVLESMAYLSKKEISTALQALEQAIVLTRHEEARRWFLDEGEGMAKLLYQAKAHQVGGEFAADLLDAFHQSASEEQIAAQPVKSLLVEPLSSREMEVLRVLAEGCSYQDITHRSALSPKTVKRHISNIYAKLGAKNRTQAVVLARSLKLIE